MIFHYFLCFISNTYKSFSLSKSFTMLRNMHFHWWFRNSQNISSLILKKVLNLSWTLANNLFHLLSHYFSIDINLIFEDLWLIKGICFEFKVSLKTWLRFQRFARVCGVMIGYENSSEKEWGSSLQVDSGGDVWKRIDKVGVFLNLETDQCIRYQWTWVKIAI